MIYDLSVNDDVLLNKTILYAKQREWIIFILQCILNTVVVVHTTSAKLFSRLQGDVARGVKKAVTQDWIQPETTVVLEELDHLGVKEQTTIIKYGD